MDQRKIALFFNHIKGCFDATSMYPIGNPIVSKHFAALIDHFEQLMDESNMVEVGFENNRFVFNGELLSPKVTDIPSFKWLYVTCVSRKILVFVFEKGFTVEELSLFFDLFKTEPSEFTELDTASRNLFRQNVHKISTNPVSADHTFSNLEPPNQARIFSPAYQGVIPTIHGDVAPRTLQGRANAVPEPIPISGMSNSGLIAKMSSDEFVDPAIVTDPYSFLNSESSVREIPKDEPKGPLFLKPSDQSTLYHSMRRFIENNQIKKVAESLTLMKRDLNSKLREDREIAFSSFQLTVQTLIEYKQTKALNSVLKSLPVDFETLNEVDLYQIHLNTLLKLIHYFNDQNALMQVTFALDILANQSLRSRPEIHALVDDALFRTLDLALLEKLSSNTTEELKPLKNSLFRTHGLAVFKSLLHALYAADNRQTRKWVLEMLHGLGAIIQPMLLQELSRAIQWDQPWYVKRNILTLLSQHTPPELLEFMPALMKEKHVRLQEITLRCLYQMPEKEAIALGSEYLSQVSEEKLGKILGYLSSGGIKDYVPLLLDLFNKTESTRKQVEIVQTLGKLDSRDSIEFLDGLLGKSSLFGGKTLHHIRVAAAQALAHSANANARGVLTRYARDKDENVKEIARLALGLD